MARLDWDRARQDRLVSERGSDRIGDDPTWEPYRSAIPAAERDRLAAKAQWERDVRRWRQQDLRDLLARVKAMSRTERTRRRVSDVRGLAEVAAELGEELAVPPRFARPRSPVPNSADRTGVNAI